MDQYASSPCHITYCYAELVHPLSTSSIIARHLLDFVVQGKITEADVPTIRLDYWCPHLRHPPSDSSGHVNPVNTCIYVAVLYFPVFRLWSCIFLYFYLLLLLPSLLWRCWLGGRKSIRPVKNPEWWGAGVVICLERSADLHMAQLMSLLLTVCCFSKIQTGFTFLVPAHPGSPGKGPLTVVCICVCYLLFSVAFIRLLLKYNVYSPLKDIYTCWFLSTVACSEICSWRT